MSRSDPVGRPNAPGLTEYALLAALALAWGTAFMFTKIAVPVLGPVTLVAVRLVLGAALIVPVLIAQVLTVPVPGLRLRASTLRLSGRDLWFFALVGLISNAVPLVMISVSVSYVDSSVTATTLALVPLLTLVMGMATGSYPTVRNVVGLGVGLVGIAVLFGPRALMSFGDDLRGALAALGAALSFSASLFVMGKVRHHPPLVVTTLALVAGALWTVPVAVLVEGVPTGWPGVDVIGAVAVLTVFNTVAASLILFALVPRTGPAFVSINNYVTPTIAVICGTLFLAEPLTLRGTLGVVIVLSGVAISTIRSGARAAVPVPPPTV